MDERPVTTAPDFWRAWLSERDFFFRMCLRWLGGNWHDAEDVISRGAIRGLDYLLRTRIQIERFRPWALWILHNLCVDLLRARGTSIIQGSTVDEDSQASRGVRSIPERALLHDELGAALSRAIAALPPRLQRAFELRFADGLHYDEISRELAISPENARKRIQQARSLLRIDLLHFAEPAPPRRRSRCDPIAAAPRTPRAPRGARPAINGG